MPDSNSSDDYNGIVQSDGGTNVTPALICNSHFFLETKSAADYESAFTQPAADKFGASSISAFRTTSKITLDDGDKKLFAICDGQVFLQPTTGSTTADPRVNLILKPFQQPIPSLGIKYFIFRNLPFAEFFDGVNVKARTASSDPDNPDDPNATDFINLLWNQFEAYNAEENPFPAFEAAQIGYQTAWLDEKPLHEVFFKISTEVATDENGEQTEQESADASVMYELPMVKKGMHLCTIADGESIGVDVVLDYGDYVVPNDPNQFKFDLAFARSQDHVLDVGNLIFETDDTQERKDYLEKVYKESCTQFIDICAFYGLHAEAGKLYVNGDNDTILEQADLVSAISGFETKHTIYLYIQANRQRSYNFYGNYEHPDGVSGNFKIGQGDTLIDDSFETGGFSWPLHEHAFGTILEPNNARFSFQLITDFHRQATLFAQIGEILSNNEEKFVRNKNLLVDIQSPNYDESTDDKYRINPITIAVTQSANLFVSALSMIVFSGALHKSSTIRNTETPISVDPADIHVTLNHDELFDPNIDSIYNINQDQDFESNALDLRLKIFNFQSTSESLVPAVLRSSLSKFSISALSHDLLVFSTSGYEIISNQSPHWAAFNPQNGNGLSINRSNSNGINQVFSNTQSDAIVRSIITYGAHTINALSVSTLNKYKSSTLYLCLTSRDIELVLETVELVPLTNARIVWFYNELREYKSYEGQPFVMGKLGIVGENPEGDSICHKLDTFPEVYSLDSSIYFSLHFSELFPENNKKHISLYSEDFEF